MHFFCFYSSDQIFMISLVKLLVSGCRLHISLEFLPFFVTFAIEFADRYDNALVCHRWRYLACHPRLWLRVERSINDFVLQRPGDTILIATGGVHSASNIQITKPLCLVCSFSPPSFGSLGVKMYSSYRI